MAINQIIIVSYIGLKNTEMGILQSTWGGEHAGVGSEQNGQMFCNVA